MKPGPTAYSYQRFSSKEQADGDSIRRQTALARAWCERNNARLDTAATFADRGKSAYRGKHRRAGGALAEFLRRVEAGDIPRGSILLIENMDRLSREKPVVGVNLLTGILIAGVRVVQLMPDEIELTEDSDLFTLFRGQMAQARGHDESKTKGKRHGDLWSEKKRQARETGERITNRLPAWVEVRGGRVEVRKGRSRLVGGKLVPIPARAKVVREMFQLAAAGRGLSLIVKHLTAGGVQPWGRGGSWSKAYVHNILTSRAVLGEHQPRRAGEPDGPPIPNYYPRIIDPDLWQRVQLALAGRKDKPGRVGKKVASLFGGLLFDARTRSKMLIGWQTRGSGEHRTRRRVLVPAPSYDGGEKCVSFPYDLFEPAVLALLHEIKEDDVYRSDGAGSESATLTAELAAVDAELAAAKQFMDEKGFSPTIGDRVKALEQKRGGLEARAAEARHREENPRPAVLAEARSLIYDLAESGQDERLLQAIRDAGEAGRRRRSVLKAADDEQHRLRLRHLIAELLTKVWVLVAVRGARRLAAVQLHFREGKVRHLLIDYTAAGNGREGSFSAAPFRRPSLDLGNPAHVAPLEEKLRAMPPSVPPPGVVE